MSNNIAEYKKILLESKKCIINRDMQTLCSKSQEMDAMSVREESMLISRASEYAELMILEIIKQLEGK